MKRKIIKQGHNTLTLTLPAEWIHKFNLSAGNEVEMVERENGLFITTQKLNENKKAEIDITGMSIPTIWKFVSGIYREGYDELIIKYIPELTLENPYKYYCEYRHDVKYNHPQEKKPISEILESLIHRFISFEVVEHGKNYIRVKEMGEISSKELDNSLRRVHLLILQMIEETQEALQSTEHSLVRHMHDVDINIDKFVDYCIRILNKVITKDQKKNALLNSTLTLLELCGDEFKNMAQHLLEDYPTTEFKNIKPLIKLLHEIMKGYYELFYKYSKDKVEELLELDKRFYITARDIHKETRNDENEILHHIRMVERNYSELVSIRTQMEF